MVVAKHIGRLGNNMFQIAASIGYAKKYGYEWAADPSNGHGEPYSSIHTSFPNLPKSTPSGFRFHEHPNKFCDIHNKHLDECHFNYHEIRNIGPDVILSGFFQSWKYFEHCKEEVKQVFKLEHIPGYEDYVSIHVRRGDYVQHSGSFPPITIDYIDSAINTIVSKGINDLNQKFVVFSDDIKWCKEQFESNYSLAFNECIEYSKGRNELQDLSLMASCGHHIIANSTFSWWGAYLGHNPNRIVISPSCENGSWFGPTAGVKHAVVDLLPPEWIQIKVR